MRLLELADARVHEALALFGEFVFGVFREVAVRTGYGNLLGEFNVELVLPRAVISS